MFATWPTWAKRYIQTGDTLQRKNTEMMQEDFEAAKEKAVKCGALSCHVADLKREFVEELCESF